MTALTASPQKNPSFSEQQITLIRRTVAADLRPEEFDLFVEMCRGWGLDPTRRQIYANVYSKDDPKKRRVVYVTAIDGYRAIADRTSCYRPGERSVVTRDDLKDKTNPYGIESATAEVWKYAQGEWHRFTETVYWEEFAPLKEIWAYDPKSDKRRPTGEMELDRSGNWARMGRVMLMKCAEAQAIRRGWPDSVSGLYVEEEMHQANVIDITPSEVVERAQHKEREERLGGPAIPIDWLDDAPLASVPVEDLHGKVRDFIKKHAEQPHDIITFAERNAAGLRMYWGLKPEEALGLKKTFESYQLTAKKQGDAA